MVSPYSIHGRGLCFRIYLQQNYIQRQIRTFCFGIAPVPHAHNEGHIHSHVGKERRIPQKSGNDNSGCCSNYLDFRRTALGCEVRLPGQLYWHVCKVDCTTGDLFWAHPRGDNLTHIRVLRKGSGY